MRYILAASKIPEAGIGCFALSPIMEGSLLNTEPERFRSYTQQSVLDDLLKYCIYDTDSNTFLGPQSFHRMSVFWYINHAREPNVTFHARRLVAKRNIRRGEELVLYYSDLLTHPKNKWWVKPEHVRQEDLHKEMA